MKRGLLIVARPMNDAYHLDIANHNPEFPT